MDLDLEDPPSPNISCCFNLNVYFIFKVSEETCKIIEKQSTIYILYVGSQSQLCILSIISSAATIYLVFNLLIDC